MNKFFGIGRLTKEVELTTTNSGVDVARFTLAIDRAFKDAKGEKQTDFLNIVVWREQAKNCSKYLEKGQQCAVVGNVQIRSYDDREGNKRSVTEIVAESVEFLGKSKQTADTACTKPSMKELEPIDDEDLPF